MGLDLEEVQYVPVVRLCLVKEKEISYSKNSISNAEKAVELTRKLIRYADREYLLAVPINARLQPCGIEIVAIGKTSEIDIDLKNLFKQALLCNASGLIVIHNHPSGGIPEPSKSDKEITLRMKAAAELLDLKLFDHLIVTDEAYVSIFDVMNI